MIATKTNAWPPRLCVGEHRRWSTDDRSAGAPPLRNPKQQCGQPVPPERVLRTRLLYAATLVDDEVDILKETRVAE
jgi:hypothetical protein